MIEKLSIDDPKVKVIYEEFVEDFDPTPQYLYDEPYRLLSFEEWLEEKDD